MATSAEIGDALSKTAIATFILIGVFIQWIGLLIMAIGFSPSVGRILGFTGLLFAFAVAVAGALGSKRTTDYQNLGLLVLAAALIISAVWIS